MFGNAKILAFHQTSRRFYPGINSIRPDNFFGLINLLKNLNVTFWSESNSPGILPHIAASSQTVVLTFDDGYKENIDVLHQLCRDGITPILFVPTAFIGKTNSWDYASSLFPAEHIDRIDIKSLSDAGVIIGSHGLSHHALTTMSFKRITDELELSKKTLEDVTGRGVDLLSYPFGRTSLGINRLAVETGYRHGMVLSDSQIFNNIEENDKLSRFSLVRTAIYSIDNYYSIRGKLLGRSKWEVFKNGIINNLAAGTIISSPRLK